MILGVLLLSIITTGMNIAGLSEFIQQMLTGAVLIAAVLVDPFRGRGDGSEVAATLATFRQGPRRQPPCKPHHHRDTNTATKPDPLQRSNRRKLY